MTSKYDWNYSDYGKYDPVQYRVFIAKGDDKGYKELTNGYSNAMPAYNDFIIEYNKPLTEGNYKVMIFVKKSSSKGIEKNSYGVYDKIYNFNFTCYSTSNAPKNDNSKVSNSSGNIVNDGMAVEDDDYIYYVNRAGDVYGAAPDYLYKIKKNDLPRKDFCDLSYNTQVIPNRVLNLNLVDDWIYYTNIADGYKIYRMKLDGSENTKICDDETLFMTVYEDTIFYSNKSDDDKLYKINANGTGKAKLSYLLFQFKKCSS